MKRLFCYYYFFFKDFYPVNTLRSHLSIPIWAVAHQTSINNLLSDNSLVIIFSVTGQFKPFDELYDNVISKNSKVVFILEEGRTEFLEKYDYTITLSKYSQDPKLLPHEKTRTTFFTFIEALIRQLNALSQTNTLKTRKK